MAQHPGEMWRTIIETSGRSQADVARAIGMSNKHMNQIVLGKALPSAELTVALAREMSDAAGRRLARALQGRGAFRRFQNPLYEHHPDLIPAWHGLRDIRAQRRAVEWLLDHALIDNDAADKFAADHPDAALP